MLRRALDAHRRLVRRIHGFRIPLGKKGRFAMGIVYVSAPVVAAHLLMRHYVYPSQERTQRELARRRIRRMDDGDEPENADLRARLEKLAAEPEAARK